MSALDQQVARGINTLLRPDGQEVHIDDIRTVAQGTFLLDELDASLIAMEAQVAGLRAGTDTRDPDWLRRVGIVLKCKRRLRPRLQQHISALRKAEKADRHALQQPTSAKDEPRMAFVLAAEEMLDHELVTEIWARARQMKPTAFGEAVRP